MKFLKQTDPEMYALIKAEEKRQKESLMMIPSENIASRAVEEAVGSVLGNKYSEGYSGKRYYQGNHIIDQVEQLVISRAQKLFGVPFVNVQPHSGSPANFAVYTALLKPGETLMGLSLASGGHLTHGANMNASSRYFKSVQYNVDKDGNMDYKEIMALAKKEKPKVIIAGTTAYSRLIDWKKFAEIAKSVNAFLMADISHIAGLVVAGVYPSPVPYVDIVTTTTHKTLRGPRGAMIMVTDNGMKKDPDLGKKINSAIIPGIQGGPHNNAIAGIGVALKEDSSPKYKKYCEQVLKNAQALAEGLKKHGFELVSGGTDSHLLLVDIRNKKLLGNTLAEGCDAAGIVFNRNGVPFDPNPPFYPSGIRLGTPGITSRGMKEKDMCKIADYINGIADALLDTKTKLNISDEDEKKKEVRAEIVAKTSQIKNIHAQVKALCRANPVKMTY
jgi:glycine hydroxymethyltransferase